MLQRTRSVLILGGLAPVAAGLLGIIFWPLAILAPVANACVGWILRQTPLRRPFLTATGVAAAGWVVALLVIGIIATAIIRPGTENITAQGLGIVAAVLLLIGLGSSPIAGFVTRWRRAPGEAAPVNVPEDSADRS